MRQASALKRVTYAAPPRPFLKPSFTAVHNHLWDSELLFTLPPAQSKLLLLIIRWTTGFQRSWCIMSEPRACKFTHLSRASFYEAKSALVRRGILITGYTTTGCSCYRLNSNLQPLIEENASEDPSIHWESSPLDPSEPENATMSGRKLVCPSTPADHGKDIKEKIKTHHQAPADLEMNDDAYSQFSIKEDLIVTSTSRHWAKNEPSRVEPGKPDFQTPEYLAEIEVLCTELEKGWPTSARPKSSAAPETSVRPALTLLQTDLAGKLELFGVNRRIAEKLVLESRPEIVQRALAGLPSRKEIVSFR